MDATRAAFNAGRSIGDEPGIAAQLARVGCTMVAVHALERILAQTAPSEDDLVVLQDDLGLWPPYHVAPVARMDTLAANAGVADALNAVAPLLTSETMIALNGLVVGDEKREPADVANEFLTQNGIVSG